MARRRAATVNSCSATAAPVAIAGNAAPARWAGTPGENLLRRTGKPRATQSFIPPSTGTAFTQPADRSNPSRGWLRRDRRRKWRKRALSSGAAFERFCAPPARRRELIARPGCASQQIHSLTERRLIQSAHDWWPTFPATNSPSSSYGLIGGMCRFSMLDFRPIGSPDSFQPGTPSGRQRRVATSRRRRPNEWPLSKKPTGDLVER